MNADFQARCIRQLEHRVHGRKKTQRNPEVGWNETEKDYNWERRGWATRRKEACTAHYHSGLEEEFSPSPIPLQEKTKDETQCKC